MISKNCRISHLRLLKVKYLKYLSKEVSQISMEPAIGFGDRLDPYFACDAGLNPRIVTDDHFFSTSSVDLGCAPTEYGAGASVSREHRLEHIAVLQNGRPVASCHCLFLPSRPCLRLANFAAMSDRGLVSEMALLQRRRS